MQIEMGQRAGKALGKVTRTDENGLDCLFGRKLREDIRVIFKYLKGYYWEEEFDILAFGLWKGTMRHLETSIPAQHSPATFLPGSPVQLLV